MSNTIIFKIIHLTKNFTDKILKRLKYGLSIIIYATEIDQNVAVLDWAVRFVVWL